MELSEAHKCVQCDRILHIICAVFIAGTDCDYKCLTCCNVEAVQDAETAAAAAAAATAATANAVAAQ